MIALPLAISSDAAGVILAALVYLALLSHGMWMRLRESPTPTAEPRIVIQMPADAVPLATLAQPGDKVVGSDRAVLFWTVFQRCVDDPNVYIDDAVKAAIQAVETVYGSIP